MSPKLDEYNRRRDPKQTPEPFTSKRGKAKQPIFVVHRHDARRLHYDFRLERNGALASWAVPKGVPLEPGARALAVHVEDHPLDYATFEGEIPKGNYGAGSVEIWDRGTYELIEEKRDGGLTVRLHGERLDGTWTLIPAHLDGKEQNWLLMRKRDETVRADGARRTYKPMLATLAETLPLGDDWVYEVKWDGYRALGYVRNGANLRMTEFQAALLNEQLTRVEEQSHIRERNAAYLTKQLAEIPGTHFRALVSELALPDPTALAVEADRLISEGKEDGPSNAVRVDPDTGAVTVHDPELASALRGALDQGESPREALRQLLIKLGLIDEE